MLHRTDHHDFIAETLRGDIYFNIYATNDGLVEFLPRNARRYREPSIGARLSNSPRRRAKQRASRDPLVLAATCTGRVCMYYIPRACGVGTELKFSPRLGILHGYTGVASQPRIVRRRNRVSAEGIKKREKRTAREKSTSSLIVLRASVDTGTDP